MTTLPAPRTLTRRSLLALGTGGLVGCAAAPRPRPASPPIPAAVPLPAAAPLRAYDLATLRRDVGDRLVLPGQPAYALARRTRQPAFDAAAPRGVLQVLDAADAADGLRAARGSGVPVHVRSGGHSYGGWSTGPGLVLDLGGLSATRLEPEVLVVGAGTRLIDVYAAVGADSALPSGSCPTVGIAGITLGGGVGVLSRQLGLTCDRLVSAEVVLPDGTMRTCSADSEPDLFWALRGGGAAPAVVLELRLSIAPATTFTVWGATFPWARAAMVLQAWDAWAPDAADELWSSLGLQAVPGGSAAQLTVTVVSSRGQGLDAELAPLLAVADPLTQGRQELAPLAAMLTEAGCGDLGVAACHPAPGEPGGRRGGTRHRESFAATSSLLAAPLGAAGAAACVACVQDRQDRRLGVGGLQLDALGGAVARVARTETAFPHRAARVLVQHAADRHAGAAPAVGAASAAWLARSRRALAPFATGGAYVNYADPGLAGWGRAYWGANLARLQEVARRYDPEGLLATGQCARNA